MAVRFELVIYSENERAAYRAGEEALDEIQRIESHISPFITTSEISKLNARAASEPVRLSPEVFNLIKIAKEIWESTQGAFDITIGQLMRLWGFRDLNLQTPPRQEQVNAVKEITGMHLVELNPQQYTVSFRKNSVAIDLGAIGKGYAIDQACSILRELGITSALIHGGTSTIAAIGTPPDSSFWKIALDLPDFIKKDNKKPLAVVGLKDNSISVSALWGRINESGETFYGHIIDPRTGYPVSNTLMSAVIMESATYTDAISTALLVLGAEGVTALKSKFNLNGLILATAEGLHNRLAIYHQKIDLLPPWDRFAHPLS